jgi:serine/threonine protein kinase
MQWVEGMSLYAWAAEHGLTLRQAIEQLAQVARALEATHRYGVHRDVKGGNVRVSAQGHAVLLDFGSCWYPGASPLTGRATPPTTGPYRSPQQLFFEYALTLGAGQYYEAQPADDVYALGVAAYRLLAGVYPPRDPDGAVRLVAPKGLNDACPELSALILRLLSEDPEARGRAGEVADKLERLLKHARPELERPWVGDPSRQPTEKTRRQAPPGYAMRVPAPRWVPAGSFLLVLLLWGLLSRNEDRREGAFTEPQGQQQATGSPDAGTSGIGEEAMASVAPAETPPVSEGRIMRELPSKPLDRQKRPPCPQRGAVEINGGCWHLPVGAETAPCESYLYEYAGRCYAPVLIPAERVPTSEEPK